MNASRRYFAASAPLINARMAAGSAPNAVIGIASIVRSARIEGGSRHRGIVRAGKPQSP